MKVLVATSRTNGAKDSDFCFTEEGELLYPGVQCSKWKECGCGRSFVGHMTLKATTTMLVQFIPYSLGQLAHIFLASHQQGGWDKFTPKDAMEMAQLMVRLAEPFEVGTVVERIEPEMKLRKRQ